MIAFFHGTWVLTKKELKDAFLSPLVYILAGLFCLMMGWLFFNYLLAAKELTQNTMEQSVIVPIFGNMNFIFLFLAPLVTMRSFAEEKKLKTLELLLTSRLSHLQIILGKFLSSTISIVFMLSLTIIFPIILSLSGYSNWPIVVSNYVGTLFSIMCYISVGLFASSITENQVVSALLGFCLLLGLMLLVLTGNAVHNMVLAQMLQYFSVPFHFESFSSGAIRSYNFVFFLSFIGFFSFLTHLSLESRKW
jgi:ABC-2 type transport system permease protein